MPVTIRTVALEGHAVKLLTRFARDETGATAIEYALMASGIALVIITVVANIGTNLNTMLGRVTTGLK